MFKYKIFLSALIIIILSSLSGCTKEDEVIITPEEDNTPTTPTAPPETNFYFTGLIDNVQHAYHTDSSFINGCYYGIYHYSCSQSTHTHNYTSTITNQFSSGQVITIYKGIFSYNGTPEANDSLFRDFFAVGNYTYSNIISQQGMSIEYKDPQGHRWNTRNNPGNQQNSNISIVSVTEGNDPGEIFVLLNFNCTVFDLNGDSLQITDGVYYGRYRNHNYIH